MIVGIAGASGLIGTALKTFLQTHDVEVRTLKRTGEAADAYWNPEEGKIELRGWEGVDVVINLAGENISSGRWTEEKKRRLRDSRIQSTQLLVSGLARLTKRPKLLLNASAVGIYGDCGDQELTEASPVGKGFLAELCQEWEGAANRAVALGVRVVNLRFGVVLSAEGGLLKTVGLPFKMGLGGTMGSGNQWMSWISLEDAVRAIWHLISRQEIQGPVNIVSPHPVTNAEWTKLLGTALHRPTFFTLPAFMARLLMGEMADELALSSTRALPKVLQSSGYLFATPRLDAAFLEQELVGAKR